MNAEYRYKYTADLMIEGLQRYRRQHHQRLWMPWLRGVSFIGLVALIAVSAYGKALFPGVIFSPFLLLPLAGSLFTGGHRFQDGFLVLQATCETHAPERKRYAVRLGKV